MPLTGWRDSGVARSQFNDVAATRLDASDSVRQVNRLTDRVRVPRVARARREPDERSADAGGLLALDDLVDPGIAGEGLGRGLARRPVAEKLHLVSFVCGGRRKR